MASVDTIKPNIKIQANPIIVTYFIEIFDMRYGRYKMLRTLQENGILISS